MRRLPDEQECSGERIRKIRKRLRYSQKRLAERTGIARGSIQKAEQGEALSLKTIKMLLDVPEFRQIFEEITTEATARRFSIVPIPGYNPYAIFGKTLLSILNQDSGYHIPDDIYYSQSDDIGIYDKTKSIGPNSVALEMLRKSTQSFIESIAHTNRASIKSKNIHIIGITCGYGWLEFDIAKLLIDHQLCKNLEVCILNGSISLLMDGANYAKERLAGYQNVTVTPILGYRDQVAHVDFCQMPLDEPPRKIFIAQTTIMNHDNSMAFLSNISSAAKKDDIFILDIAASSISQISEREIRRTDFRYDDESLISEDPGYQLQVGTVLKNIVPNIVEVQYSTSSILQPQLLGGIAEYGINLEASLHFDNRRSIKTSALRFYRFRINHLERVMRSLGWALVHEYRIEPDKRLRLAVHWLTFIRVACP